MKKFEFTTSSSQKDQKVVVEAHSYAEAREKLRKGIRKGKGSKAKTVIIHVPYSCKMIRK